MSATGGIARGAAAAGGGGAARGVLRVEPSRGWVSLRLGELWAYRELLYFLVWRDIKVRYKQTALGAAWAVIQPFFTMVVFSLFFGRLAGVKSDNVPYPIFAYAALVPYPLVWAHEAADAPHDHPRFAELATLAELPSWIDTLA